MIGLLETGLVCMTVIVVASLRFGRLMAREQNVDLRAFEDIAERRRRVLALRDEALSCAANGLRDDRPAAYARYQRLTKELAAIDDEAVEEAL